MKSESELRAIIRRSREDGFKALFSQYSGYVYAIVYNHIRAVGTREDAEEAVSDVFSALFRSLDQIEEGKLENYLRVIAKRTAIDTFRRLSAHSEASLDEDGTWQEAVSEEDIEQDIERAALRQTLLAAIRSLGEPDATIIMMKYFYDCTADEIGKVVGMNRITVWTRLSRARAKLRELLADEDITF